MQVIRRVLHGETGIEIADAKVALVGSRLAKRLRALRLPNFAAYCKLIEGRDGVDERKMMISALTTNVTRFFREPHHFDDLRERLRGPLGARVRQGGRLRIWSAGCSTGEEPYSMAMTVLEIIPEAHSLDVKILATDLDPVVLKKAAAGRYPVRGLAEVPQARQHFEPDGADGMVAGPALRRLVTVRPLNLVRPWPLKGPFDAIFCRNVAIYFDAATQAGLWERFAALLGPEGRLHIGHSERLTGPATEMLGLRGTTTYGPPGRGAGGSHTDRAGEKRCR
jgi:chemotaxis protein methyltransferase CheR